MDRKRGMKLRDLTGVILLLVLLLAGLLSAWYAGRQHTALSRQLEESSWLALSGQWQQARETSETARQRWQQHWKLWTALGDHSPMADIDVLFSRLSVYAAGGEREEFAAVSKELAQRLLALADAHTLHWWNVL